MGALDPAVAAQTTGFARRLLGHEDAAAILAELRKTAAAWLAADHVDVSTGEAAGRAAGDGTFGGFQSVLVTEVATRVSPVTLRVCSSRPDAFDESARAVVALLADLTAVALETAHKLSLFHEALARRDTIGRAKGVLSERYGIDDEHAFALLRRLSQQRNRRLVAIAEDVAAGRLDPAGAASPGSRTPA